MFPETDVHSVYYTGGKQQKSSLPKYFKAFGMQRQRYKTDLSVHSNQ